MFLSKARWVVTAGIVALVAGLGGNCQDQPKKEKLIDLLPEDTSFVVTCKNINNVQAKWDISPFAKFFQHEGIQQFVKLIEREVSPKLEEFRKDMGFEIKDFLNQFSGEVVLACGNPEAFFKRISKVQGPKGWDKPDKFAVEEKDIPDIFLLAETKDDKKTKEFMEKMFGRAKEKHKSVLIASEICQGVPLITFGKTGENIKGYYAQNKGVFILTFSKKAMEYILSAGKKEKRNRFGEQEVFRTMTNKVHRDSDFLAYFDLKPLIKIIKISKIDIPGMEQEKISKVFFDLTGFDNLEAIAMGGTFGKEDVGFNVYLKTIGEPKGIVKSILVENEKWEIPFYVPKNAINFGFFRFDVKPFWSGIKKFIKDMMVFQKEKNPKMPDIDPLEQMKVMLGFAPDDIVEALGNKITYFQLEAPGGQQITPTFYILDISDKDKAEDILDKLMNNPMIAINKEVSQIDGKSIFTVDISSPLQKAELSIAVFGRQLIFYTGMKGAEKMKEFLTLLVNRNNKDSLNDNDDYKILRENLPKEATMINYASPLMFYEWVRVQAEIVGKMPMGMFPKEIDLTKMPPKEFYSQLFSGGISSAVKEKDGLFYRGLLRYK